MASTTTKPEEGTEAQVPVEGQADSVTNGKPAKPAASTSKPKPAAGSKPKPAAAKPKPDKPAPTAAPAASDEKPTGTPTPSEPSMPTEAELLDARNIAQIKQWEAEAESLTGEADAYRAQAAAAIVKELGRDGVSERMVADAIGKSPSHVHFAVVAWRMMQDPDESVESFNEAYKRAKRPRDQHSDDGQSPADDEAAGPGFPPWAKQVRTWNELTSVMIAQANLKQIKQLLSMLEKSTKNAAVQEMDLDTTGQSQ